MDKPEEVSETEALRREVEALRKAQEEDTSARPRQMLGIVALVVLIVIVCAVVFTNLQSEADRVNGYGAPAIDVAVAALR